MFLYVVDASRIAKTKRESQSNKKCFLFFGTWIHLSFLPIVVSWLRILMCSFVILLLDGWWPFLLLEHVVLHQHASKLQQHLLFGEYSYFILHFHTFLATLNTVSCMQIDLFLYSQNRESTTDDTKHSSSSSSSLHKQFGQKLQKTKRTNKAHEHK